MEESPWARAAGAPSARPAAARGAVQQAWTAALRDMVVRVHDRERLCPKCHGESPYMSKYLQLLTSQSLLRTQQLRVIAVGQSASQVCQMTRARCQQQSHGAQRPSLKPGDNAAPAQLEHNSKCLPESAGVT